MASVAHAPTTTTVRQMSAHAGHAVAAVRRTRRPPRAAFQMASSRARALVRPAAVLVAAGLRGCPPAGPEVVRDGCNGTFPASRHAITRWDAPPGNGRLCLRRGLEWAHSSPSRRRAGTRLSQNSVKSQWAPPRLLFPRSPRAFAPAPGARAHPRLSRSVPRPGRPGRRPRALRRGSSDQRHPPQRHQRRHRDRPGVRGRAA